MNLNIQICKEVKQSLAWSFQFKCINCVFLSKLYSAFNKILKTKKSASINSYLAIALMETSMVVSQAKLLFTSLDIPPPTKSLLQRLTDKVSQDIIQLNDADMAEKICIVEQHNLEAGVRNLKHIDVSMDGSYNARRFKSSYKPGHTHHKHISSHREHDKGAVYYWNRCQKQAMLDRSMAQCTVPRRSCGLYS